MEIKLKEAIMTASAFLTFTVIALGRAVAALHCDPVTQRIRNNGQMDICCFTVICKHNQNFVSCKWHNGTDTCDSCPPGTCYDNRINSKYFEYPDKSVCKAVDSQCDRNGGAISVFSKESCMPVCVCDVANGFYDYDQFSRDCKHTDRKCDTPGVQLSSKTGQCVPCVDGWYKSQTKGLCIRKRSCLEGEQVIDEGSTTRDRQCGVPESDMTVTVTSSITVTTETGKDSISDEDSLGTLEKVLISAAGGIVALILLFLGIYLYRRRRRQRTQRRLSRQSKTIDIELQLQGDDEDSTVTCASCGNTVCSCIGLETQPKQPYHGAGDTQRQYGSLNPQKDCKKRKDGELALETRTNVVNDEQKSLHSRNERAKEETKMKDKRRNLSTQPKSVPDFTEGYREQGNLWRSLGNLPAEGSWKGHNFLTPPLEADQESGARSKIKQGDAPASDDGVEDRDQSEIRNIKFPAYQERGKGKEKDEGPGVNEVNTKSRPPVQKVTPVVRQPVYDQVETVENDDPGRLVPSQQATYTRQDGIFQHEIFHMISENNTQQSPETEPLTSPPFDTLDYFTNQSEQDSSLDSEDEQDTMLKNS